MSSACKDIRESLVRSTAGSAPPLLEHWGAATVGRAASRLWRMHLVRGVELDLRKDRHAAGKPLLVGGSEAKRGSACRGTRSSRLSALMDSW